MIDRSKTRDIPLHPSAVKGRSNDWNLCRGNHLGQRSCANATIGRTYGRKRSDQSTAQQLARSGPSTYGRKRSDQSTAQQLARSGPSTYGRKRSDQSTAQQLARSGPSTYGRKRSDQSTAQQLARSGPSTYGRKRSDQSTAQQLARSGPSTYGSRKVRARSDGLGCHAAHSPPTPSAFTFTRSPTTSATSCAHWRRRSRSKIGR